MIEVNAFMFSLLVESTVVFAFGLLLWLVLAIRRRRLDRRSALELAGQFKDGREQREQSARELFTRLGALEGVALQTALQQVERDQAAVFERLITAYVRRDGETLARVKPALDGLLERFYGLQVEAAPAEAAGDPEAATREKALRERLAGTEERSQRLQEENEKLAADLAQARNEIDAMLEEYSAMFEGGVHAEMRRERYRQDARHRVEDGYDHGLEIGADTANGDGESAAGATASDRAALEPTTVEPPEEFAQAEPEAVEPPLAATDEASLADEWAALLGDSDAAAADPDDIEAEFERALQSEQGSGDGEDRARSGAGG